MASTGEVKSTVNSLEVSPSKSDSCSKLPRTASVGGGSDGGKGFGTKKSGKK